MSKTVIVCVDCSIPLIKDHIALSKKMLGRYIEKYYCIDCLAKLFECEKIDLEIKIQEFKEQGCSLFL
jgi:hypothetical protein